jgi:DNA-binding winged helix-turn-helix (wHTH) protein
MTDTPATSTEAEEQNETTPRLTSPSPQAGPRQTTPAIDDSSVDLSAVVSDTTQNISQLRRALDLAEQQDNIAFTEDPGNTYPSPANKTKEPRPSKQETPLSTQEKEEEPSETSIKRFKTTIQEQNAPLT